MRTFRTFHRVLAAVLALIVGGPALAMPVGSLGYVEAIGLRDNYVHAKAKFEAELVYHAQLPAGSMIALNSDLRRDSHGYRQSTADEFEIEAPTEH